MFLMRLVLQLPFPVLLPDVVLELVQLLETLVVLRNRILWILIRWQPVDECRVTDGENQLIPFGLHVAEGGGDEDANDSVFSCLMNATA